MPRENAATKAHRLLAEGRLNILARRDDDFIFAEVRGDQGATYRCGHDPNVRQWRCTCPARGRCSHLIALQLVTAVRA